ncbi:MAG: hypothetical protein JSU65_04905 [Candidatus Zixiibacteriota bacterium]|nr:MAG: hypothetical protein JSU65_04905 [candidate division Zixibacteria bacterium]
MKLTSVLPDHPLIILGVVLYIALIPRSARARYERPPSKDVATAAQENRIATALPQVQYTAHNRGNIQLAVANNGTFGTFGDAFIDPFTGDVISSCFYPRNTDLVYLWVGAFWIGAVVGRDTVVSCGSDDYYQTSEFWPEEPPLGEFQYNSIDVNSKFYNPSSRLQAHSEQDVYAEYYDTVTDPGLTGLDPIDGRPHRPLGIKVSQRSMSWSYEYADDFILFDYQVQNIGKERLKKVYMGIWVDGDVWHLLRRGGGEGGWDDDVVGFLETFPAPEGCEFIDTVTVAYHMDNNGDPVGGQWNHMSPRSAVGVRLVRTPGDTLKYSFNWWIVGYDNVWLDFGPRMRGRAGDPFRDMGRLGTPEGDRNKYYLLSHVEFDYDTYFTAVDHSLDGWLPPPSNASDFADGYDSRYLLSFGPFDIEPGQTLPVSFAWVGGETVHTRASNFETLFDPNHPEEFYRTLDFSGLALNARWADWVYDNPGVDTDGDGFAGHGRICDIDSAGKPLGNNDSIPPGIDSDNIYWYRGDGVPDFRGAGPPPAPMLRVIPSQGRMTLRWNGFHSETTPDVFLHMPDFEGYRVYAGLDERDESFTLLASYDNENYNRFRWNDDPEEESSWLLEEIPFTKDSLRNLFGDPDLEPLDHPRYNPYHFGDQLYYFEAQDFNASRLNLPVGIRKAYPEYSVRPSTDSSLWTEDEVTYEHGSRLPKYYEYEYDIIDLLATVPYYVSVTAFDFGSPVVGLPALESQPINNHIAEFAQTPVDTVEAHHLDVYVYPQPYRVDAQYRSRGLEGRLLHERDRPDDRVRRIHFANLPNVCKIRIYTIDGDLVRVLEHDYPDGGPGSMHDSWDLITRNTQLAVSGLYYWVVESDKRTQIGKLVILQ